MQLLFILIGAATFLGVPITFFAGWTRWARAPRERGVFAQLSLAAFSLATFSLLLAVGGVLFAHFGGQFSYHDPRLGRLYVSGLVTSFLALILSGFGVRRK